MRPGVADRLAGRLNRGQTAAEARMTDTFTAYAFTTVKVDGINEQVWAQVGDPVKGRIPSRRSGDPVNVITANVGGVDRIITKGGLHLEWSAEPKDGQVYVLTELGPSSHPSMLGKAWRVVEPEIASQQTAWRLDVYEVDPPEEA